jgi:hypothetical protein
MTFSEQRVLHEYPRGAHRWTQFSETLEDVSPALQATGWAFFGFIARGGVAISAPIILTIAVHPGWDT